MNCRKFMCVWHLLIVVCCIFSSILTVQAQQAKGLKPVGASAYNNLEKSKPLPSYGLTQETLPRIVDLSSYFPVPRSQGSQGSCTAWAVAYAARTYVEKTRKGWELNTDSHIFSPSYIYNEIHRGQCEGTAIPDALNLLKNQGVISLAEFPYDQNNCSTTPNAVQKQKAANFKIKGWRSLNLSINEVKVQIAAGNPVILAVPVGGEFQRWRGSGIFNTYELPNELANHAMVICGYSDTEKYFKVMNSWGNNWGDNGYIKVAYDFFSKGFGYPGAVELYVIDEDIHLIEEKEMVIGQSISGEITPNDGIKQFTDQIVARTDAYRFYGTKGQKIAIRANKAGALFFYFENKYINSEGGQGTVRTIPSDGFYTLENTGSYYIYILGISGDYNLSLFGEIPIGIGETLPGSIEDTDFFCKEAAPGKPDDDKRPADLYTFDGLQGQEILITLRTNTSGLRPILVLHDTENLYINSEGGSPTLSIPNNGFYKLPKTGKYRIYVSRFEGRGKYELTVSGHH